MGIVEGGDTYSFYYKLQRTLRGEEMKQPKSVKSLVLERATEKLQFNATRFRLALMKALSNIGHRNGHTRPVGASDFLHSLYVTQEGKHFFDKEYKTRIDLVKDMNKDVLDGLAGGEAMTLEVDPVYALTVQTKQPSERLDAKAFINELRKLGVPLDAIEQARKNATKTTAVPKSFTVALNEFASTSQ